MLKDIIKKSLDGVRISKRTEFTPTLKTGTTAVKTELLETSTVTIDGLVFDADEMSQLRMMKAIRALEIKNMSTIRWKLNNNETVDITRDVLERVFVLSVDNQYDIWMSA